MLPPIVNILLCLTIIFVVGPFLISLLISNLLEILQNAGAVAKLLHAKIFAKSLARKQRKADIAARKAHREYVEDLFRQIG